MNRIHLSETIFQLYFLFDFEDSNEFIIWQFMDYFQCHDLDIPDLTVSEMYLSQNSLLKSFLQHDLFYVVIYKIHKIQECLSLSGLKNHILNTYVDSCNDILNQLLTYLYHVKIYAVFSNSTIQEYLKTHSFLSYILDSEFLPLDLILITNENETISLFPTSRTSMDLIDSKKKNSFLIRDRARTKCHNVCQPMHHKMLMHLKQEIDEWDIVQYPFAKIYQRNFYEIYASLIKSINIKSKIRKKAKLTL